MVAVGRRSARSGADQKDPRRFPDELSRILCVLDLAGSGGRDSWLRTSEISTRLVEDFGIAINVRRAFAVLSDNPNLAARRKRAGQWQFRILYEGRRKIEAPSEAVVLVNPSQPIPATIELHGFLSRLLGTVRVCDPYLDPTTIAHLDSCKAGVKVKVLTDRVHEEATVRVALTQFARNGRSVEVKRCGGGKLHDRFIIDDRAVFYLGTSLNSFGKTYSAIFELGSSIRSALLRQFDDEWQTAKAWK